MSFLNLNNKTFLVFGVANKKSLAFFIAKTLEEEGAQVMYSVRSQERKDSLAKLLEGKAVFICDVEDPIQIQQLAKNVGSEYGPIDGIVHSIAFADYREGFKPFHETSRKNFLQATAI